jgi:hypothetical protein
MQAGPGRPVRVQQVELGEPEGVCRYTWWCKWTVSTDEVSSSIGQPVPMTTVAPVASSAVARVTDSSWWLRVASVRQAAVTTRPPAASGSRSHPGPGSGSAGASRPRSAAVRSGWRWRAWTAAAARPVGRYGQRGQQHPAGGRPGRRRRPSVRLGARVARLGVVMQPSRHGSSGRASGCPRLRRAAAQPGDVTPLGESVWPLDVTR